MMREFDSNKRVAPVNGEALALRQTKGALHGQRLFARKAIRATIRKRRWRRLPRSLMRVRRAAGERIAHALNFRIRSIQLRQPLIDGIALEVVELLKDRHVPRWRRVRSIEAATGAERHASRSRVGERQSLRLHEHPRDFRVSRFDLALDLGHHSLDLSGRKPVIEIEAESDQNITRPEVHR
jgi:hypothetical protein